MTFSEIIVIGFIAVASFSVVAGFVTMLVGSERRPVRGRRRSQIAPGWYPDAQDESLLRYFDGHEPTRRTSRRELT